MKYILLLDDDPDEYWLLKEAFKEMKMAVELHWFPDFESLCTHLDEGARIPDMIFLDINMPRLTGMDCLKHLKSKPAYADIPVIIYTNSDYQKNIEHCFTLGATVYLKKSNSLGHLQNNLQRIMAWNLFTALSLPAFDRTILN